MANSFAFCRDLRDAGVDVSQDGIPLHALRGDYGRLKIKNGVLFLTYSMLIRKNGNGSQTRLQQILNWCNPESFQGLVVFDESHKVVI